MSNPANVTINATFHIATMNVTLSDPNLKAADLVQQVVRTMSGVAVPHDKLSDRMRLVYADPPQAWAASKPTEDPAAHPTVETAPPPFEGAVEVDTDAATTTERPAFEQKVTTLPSVRTRRGRPRKCVLEDEEMIAQAREMLEQAEGGAGGAGGATVPDGAEDEPDQAEATDETDTEVELEHDANPSPPHDENGVVLAFISPDAPELGQLRDSIRARGYTNVLDALAYLGELLGRPVNRIGEVTLDEARDVLRYFEENP